MTGSSIFGTNIAQIVRSQQKDENYAAKLENEIQPIAKQLLTVRDWIKCHQLISNGSALLYYLLTWGVGNQTLGEEYCNIIQVTTHRTIPSLTKRLLLTCICSFDSSLTRLIVNLTTKCCPSLNSESSAIQDNLNIIVDFLKRFNISLFYLNGSYPRIYNRVFAISYLSTMASHPLTRSNNRASFRLLGYLNMIYLMLSLYVRHGVRMSKWSGGDHGDAQSAKTAVQAVQRSTSAGKCLLCLCPRWQPTLTPCGHAFCWNCLYHWLAHQHHCPICRNHLQPNRLVYLHNYQ